MMIPVTFMFAVTVVTMIMMTIVMGSTDGIEK